MAKTISYEYECDCGGKAKNIVLDTTQEDENVIHIDVDFNVLESELECRDCGKRYFVSGQVDEVEE